jgi:hypothetical protein
MTHPSFETNNDANFHAFFARHPNRTDMQIYKGKQFRQAYRGVG